MTKMMKLSALMMVMASGLVGCGGGNNYGYDLALTAGTTFIGSLAGAFGSLISTILFGVPQV
jgi:ABC-type glycerol-3-phosphate transport system substrate-binding protein